MKRITLFLLVMGILAVVAVFTATTSRHVTAQEVAPIFVKEIPPGYRDWRVVSVAHEAGDLNDISRIHLRAVMTLFSKVSQQRKNHRAAALERSTLKQNRYA